MPKTTEVACQFDGLTVGGVSYGAEQGAEIIQYARDHGITQGRAAELLAEIKGWPRPRNIGRPRGTTPSRHDGVRAAIHAAGGLRALARLLRISHQAILQWERVPAERVIEIETLAGIARERLRPDLYRLPPRHG